MITNTTASNMVNSDNDSGGNNKKGWGVFTIIIRNLLSFIIITTITISIIRFSVTEDGGMMMAATIDLREKPEKNKNSTKDAERV